MSLLGRVLGKSPEQETPVDLQHESGRIGGVAAALGALAVLAGVAAGSLGFEAAGDVVLGGLVVAGIGSVALIASGIPSSREM